MDRMRRTHVERETREREKDPSITVLSETRVSPPRGTVPATSSLPLTFFDAMWLFELTVQRLFFYPFPHPTAHFVTTLLPALQSSLSHTLRHFHHLAGVARLSPGSPGHFEIFYADGDSVPFTAAECSGYDFHKLTQRLRHDFSRVQPLVPDLPVSHFSQPLLALQATVFPNTGITIGVAIHHVAGDGSSSVHFIKSWALAFKYYSGGTGPPPPLAPLPSFDRSAVIDPRGLYSSLVTQKLELLKENHHPTELAPPIDLVSATFTLRRNHIHLMKLKTVGSKFQLACGYVWSCLVKARRHIYPSDAVTAHLMFPADCRSRLRPPVPAAYFGNCLAPGIAEDSVGSLAGEDGFSVATRAIGRAIQGLGDGHDVLDDAEEWIGRIRAVLGATGRVTIAGSPKLRVYDTDFGWGRPLKVEVTSIQSSRAFSLAESREDEDGLEIGLVLQKNDMDAFETHFNRGLELLSSCAG